MAMNYELEASLNILNLRTGTSTVSHVINVFSRCTTSPRHRSPLDMLLVAAPHLCEAVISATPQKASPSSPLSTLVSALIPVRRSIRKKNNGMESINVETRECCKNIRCTSIIPKWEEKYVMQWNQRLSHVKKINTVKLRTRPCSI